MRKLLFLSFFVLPAIGVIAWFKSNIVFIIFALAVVVLPLITILIIRQLGKAANSRIVANSIFCWLCNYKDETEEKWLKLKRQHASQVALEKYLEEDN
jgi:hypothetical protein